MTHQDALLIEEGYAGMKKSAFTILLTATFLLTASGLLKASNANAATLSKEALYNRCYAQLTGTIVPDDDPNVAAFRVGTGDPIGACLALLDRARLTAAGNTAIGDSNDAVAKKVLSRMHNAHTGFFSQSSFHTPDRTNQESESRDDMFDPGAPALFYTRALFAPSVDASSIVTGTANYKALRTTASPATGPRTGRAKTDFVFRGQAAFVFAPIGEMLGVVPTGPITIDYTFGVSTARTTSFGANYGGGVLGSPGYFLNTVSEDEDLRSTNLKLPRRWAKAVFHDFLCREFPSIRVADGASFVNASAQNPFRRSESCTQCHATMDRTASVLRGFQYMTTVSNPTIDNARGPMWYRIEPVSLPAETGWPATTDANFYKRPPNGTFYYRTASDGTLVNLPLTGVADLGTKISQQDDFYICLANHYWNYFTAKGVDIDEPAIFANRPQKERNRFAIIKALGLNLRAHQSLRQLVEEIMRRAEYSDSAFGTN